jgi:hypothetical protein
MAIQRQRSTLQSATVSYIAAAEVRAMKSEGTGLSGAARGQSSMLELALLGKMIQRGVKVMQTRF